MREITVSNQGVYRGNLILLNGKYPIGKELWNREFTIMEDGHLGAVMELEACALLQKLFDQGEIDFIRPNFPYIGSISMLS